METPVNTFTLRNRTVIVGNRRIRICEMLESEVHWFKAQRMLAFVIGASIGMSVELAIALAWMAHGVGL